MKRKQKIIVVLSCIALLISVLAVNCFAWMGQASLTTRSAINTVTAGFFNQDVDLFLQNEGVTLLDKRVAIPFNSSNLVTNSTDDKIAYGETYTQFTPSDDNIVLWSQIESYYSADGQSTVNCSKFLELFGNIGSIEPCASDISLEYSPFLVGGDFESLLYDSVTLYDYVGENGDDYSMCGQLWFYVPLIVYYADEAEIVKVSVQVDVEGTPSPGESFMLIEQDSLTVRVGGSGPEYYYNDTIIDCVKESVESHYTYALSADPLYKDAYCYSAYFAFYGECTGFEIEAQTPTRTNGEGELSIPTEVTIEEVIQVVEEVQVEPFQWIIQAIDGVLDTELFGTLTIGHLILCAIAIPALLAILRAISGG